MSKEKCLVHLIKDRKVVSVSDAKQLIGKVEVIDKCVSCDTQRVITISREGYIGYNADTWVSSM